MSRLVLTRKPDQNIIIHDQNGLLASIKVSKIDKNQVRLTFEAENDVKIDREEIYLKKIS